MSKIPITCCVIYVIPCRTNRSCYDYAFVKVLVQSASTDGYWASRKRLLSVIYRYLRHTWRWKLKRKIITDDTTLAIHKVFQPAFNDELEVPIKLSDDSFITKWACSFKVKVMITIRLTGNFLEPWGIHPKAVVGMCAAIMCLRLCQNNLILLVIWC